MNTKIIIDSTIDIAERYRKDVQIVPLTIRFGDRELIDGVTVTRQKFYEMLIECDALPTTSQATPAAFETEFANLNGADAIVITISSKLSGTYQSACIAAADFPNVRVIDSQSASIGSGILAEYAVECAKKGMPADEIAERLTNKREDVCAIALLDTLEYLKRGGRISKTVAAAGTLLNIKPVATIENGAIALIGKARGSKQGNNLLVKKIHEIGGVDFSMPVLLGYTGVTDVFLKKYVEDSRALWEDNLTNPDCVQVGSVIGTHAGPGAVVAAFFRKA